MQGEPAVVLVGGEGGVGKTRLVEEAAERARGGGARVLTGSCIELGGEGLPLSPVVDALRTLTRVMDADELDGFLGSRPRGPGPPAPRARPRGGRFNRPGR